MQASSSVASKHLGGHVREQRVARAGDARVDVRVTSRARCRLRHADIEMVDLERRAGMRDGNLDPQPLGPVRQRKMIGDDRGPVAPRFHHRLRAHKPRPLHAHRPRVGPGLGRIDQHVLAPRLVHGGDANRPAAAEAGRDRSGALGLGVERFLTTERVGRMACAGMGRERPAADAIEIEPVASPWRARPCGRFVRASRDDVARLVGLGTRRVEEVGAPIAAPRAARHEEGLEAPLVPPRAPHRPAAGELPAAAVGARRESELEVALRPGGVEREHKQAVVELHALRIGDVGTRPGDVRAGQHRVRRGRLPRLAVGGPRLDHGPALAAHALEVHEPAAVRATQDVREGEMPQIGEGVDAQQGPRRTRPSTSGPALCPAHSHPGPVGAAPGVEQPERAVVQPDLDRPRCHPAVVPGPGRTGFDERVGIALPAQPVARSGP